MDSNVSLNTPIRFLKGVGPERSRILAKLGLFTLGDLFHYFPRRYEDRQPVLSVSEARPSDEKICVRGQVSSRGLLRLRGGRSIFKVVLTDGTKSIFASWFNQPYLAKVFLPKSQVVFYGKADAEGKKTQLVHPEYEVIPPGVAREPIHSGRIVPIYPLTEELYQKTIRYLIYAVTRQFHSLIADPLPYSLRMRLDLGNAEGALMQIHFPKTFDNLKRAYKRLVFDEFFYLQMLVLTKRRQWQKENKEVTHKTGEESVGRLLDSLGFELTAGQKTAVNDIISDMKKTRPMNRLVQGDVGSGKTAVAAAALAFTAANGFQGVLMAPTEILAQQHYIQMTQALEPLGIRCGYLAQGQTADERANILDALERGTIHVAVGTHALIQGTVAFKRLGLAIIDEQHKFGVFQRALLKEKGQGRAPHFLLMTATPIPRTLAMTLYGDMDVSVIRELPKGRLPIKTFWVGENKREEIYGFIESYLKKGQQCYMICPLVDTRGTTSQKSALELRSRMQIRFPKQSVDVLHGRQKSDDKKRIMKQFKDGKIHILVSTVVIEVGIDVPNANLMIIENAERFGLSQLHQLRGRVGRGSEESFCILFSDTVSPETAERLGAFEEMTSGFEIAEKDLELRGAGEITGQKQHGFPELRIGDLVKDFEILESARREAGAILETDPFLTAPEHRKIRQALQDRFTLQDKPLAALA